MARRSWWLAMLVVALVAAGCGRGATYKGGEVPEPPEGGLRGPDVEITSLDSLRGPYVRLTERGFSTDVVSMGPADPLSIVNDGTTPYTLHGEGSEGFRRARLKPNELFQHSFDNLGTVRVRADTDPPSTLLVQIQE